MPYLLVTTQIRLEAGPCIVGDEKSDPELMEFLQAKMRQENGQFFKVNNSISNFEEVSYHYYLLYKGLGNRFTTKRGIG